MPGESRPPDDLPRPTPAYSPHTRPLHKATGDLTRSDDPDILVSPDSDATPHQQLGSAALKAPAEEPADGRDSKDTAPPTHRLDPETDRPSRATLEKWRHTLEHLEPAARRIDTITTGRPHREGDILNVTFDIACHETTTDGPEQPPTYEVTLALKDGADVRHFSSHQPPEPEDVQKILAKANDVQQQLPAEHGNWVEEATLHLVSPEPPTAARPIDRLIAESPYTLQHHTKYSLTDHPAGNSTVNAEWHTVSYAYKHQPYAQHSVTLRDHSTRLTQADGTEITASQATDTNASLAALTRQVREATDYQEPQPPDPATLPPDPRTAYVVDRLLQSMDAHGSLVRTVASSGICLDNGQGATVDIRCAATQGTTGALLATETTLDIRSPEGSFHASSAAPKTTDQQAIIADALDGLSSLTDLQAVSEWLDDAKTHLLAGGAIPPETAGGALVHTSPFTVVTENHYTATGLTHGDAHASRTWVRTTKDPPDLKETFDGSGQWETVPPQVTHENLRLELPDQQVVLYANVDGQRHVHALSPGDRQLGSGLTTPEQELATFQRRVSEGTCKATAASFSALLEVLEHGL